MSPSDVLDWTSVLFYIALVILTVSTASVLLYNLSKTNKA